ncbi:MAG: ferritin family protein [Nitrospirae bacterium]|nr:ferritin family protein [Nitrospirota bacterium]
MNSVEIAIRMETDAIRFYKEASEKCNHEIGKKMFLSIVEDEKRHLDMLSAMLKGLNMTLEEASPMKNIKLIFEEMKNEMIKRIEATTDELEAFNIAMGMEKEGVEFYKKASDQALKEKEKKLFEMLVHEEEQHYNIFANTYFFMKDTGNWYMWEEHSIIDGGSSWA